MPLVKPVVAQSHAFLDGGIQVTFTETPERVAELIDDGLIEGQLVHLHSPSRVPGDPAVDCWLDPRRLIFVGPPGDPQKTVIGDPATLNGRLA